MPAPTASTDLYSIFFSVMKCATTPNRTRGIIRGNALYDQTKIDGQYCEPLPIALHYQMKSDQLKREAEALAASHAHAIKKRA